MLMPAAAVLMLKGAKPREGVSAARTQTLREGWLWQLLQLLRGAPKRKLGRLKSAGKPPLQALTLAPLAPLQDARGII